MTSPIRILLADDHSVVRAGIRQFLERAADLRVVAEDANDGTPVFDLHAANCTVCVDITHDQMRLMDAGLTPEQIRGFIDSDYAKYGPPTPLSEG